MLSWYAGAIGLLFLVSALRDTLLIGYSPTAKGAALIIKTLVTANYLSTLSTDYFLNSGVSYSRKAPILILGLALVVAVGGHAFTAALIAGIVLSSLSRALVFSPFVLRGDYYRAPLFNVFDALLVIGILVTTRRMEFSWIVGVHLGNSVLNLAYLQLRGMPEMGAQARRYPDLNLLIVNTLLLLLATLGSNFFYSKADSYYSVYAGRVFGYMSNILVLASTPIAHHLHVEVKPYMTALLLLLSAGSCFGLLLPLPAIPLFATTILCSSLGIICVRLHTFKPDSAPELSEID